MRKCRSCCLVVEYAAISAMRRVPEDIFSVRPGKFRVVCRQHQVVINDSAKHHSIVDLENRVADFWECLVAKWNVGGQ